MLSAIIPTRDDTSYRTQAGLAQGESDHAPQSNVQTRGSRAPAFGIRPAMEGIMSAGEEVFHPDRRGGDMDVDMDFVSPCLGKLPPFTRHFVGKLTEALSQIQHASIPIPVTTSTPPIPIPLHPASASFSRRRITLDPPSKEVTTILQTLSESGIEKDSLVALLMSVPDKGMADSLTELYFREIE